MVRPQNLAACHFARYGTGRDHNPDAFTCFMVSQVKAGMSYGASDEFGLKAVDTRTSVYDFNATILHLAI